MYAGDGWAGEKVKGQTQDYTNTVQTERLRETLRKEMVRTSRRLPASAFCSKTLTVAVLAAAGGCAWCVGGDGVAEDSPGNQPRGAPADARRTPLPAQQRASLLLPLSAPISSQLP